MMHDIPDQFEHRDDGRGTRDELEGRDGEALLHKCCADLGVNYAVALQIVAWCDENLGPASGGNGEVEGENGVLRDASIIKILEFLWRKAPSKHLFAVLYAFNQPLLDDIIAHRNVAEFARDIECSREAVNKIVTQEVQPHFRLPARREQRDGQARRNMSEARLKQLKG